MIVQCPSCEARYRIGTENVPPQGGKITCPSCSQSFIVYPEAADTNDDETRAGNVPFVLKEAGMPEIEDGTVEIQNPMKTWLEQQKQQQLAEQNILPPDEAATSVLTVNDLPFDNFSEDDELDDKTEMINLGDFLELENSEAEDTTEVFTLADHEAQQVGLAKPKATLMDQGFPTINSGSSLPPLAKPGTLPPLQNNSGLPPLQKPSTLPPLTAPSSLPPLNSPSSLPPLQKPSILPPPQNLAPAPVSSIPTPAPLPTPTPSPLPTPSPVTGPPTVDALSQPPLNTQIAVNDPIPTLGVGQQNVEADPNFNGPWKLRTNFGLTYEFPDTLSLNSWISSREDVSGYTLAGNGDFYPLSYFPQVRPKHAGTSGSFSLQQPRGLPESDFLNAPPATATGYPAPSGYPPPAVHGAQTVDQIPMLQQPQTDYKAFSKSDTNVPAKESGGILPLLAWVFCAISALVMIATALYVFGIIGASSPALLMSSHLF